MPIRLGFIGAGFIAQVAHLPAFSMSRHFTCVAIADPRSDMRDAVADSYGIKCRYNDHLSILQSGEVDAAVVTLPRPLTARVVEDCLAHKIWVFTEKPLLLNQDSAHRLLRKVGNRGVYVGFMKRCDPGVLRLVRLLKDKTEVLGSLESVAATCHAGDSYFGISGDLKSSQERVLVSEYEEIPSCVPKRRHQDYEQFLNTYSHTLNLTEFVTQANINLESCVYALNGAGHFLGYLDEIPFSLSVSRGKYHPWFESVTLKYENAVVSVKLPAAFNKLGEARVEVFPESHFEETPESTCNKNWAFYNQPGRFLELIQGELSPIEDILSAWRYAENAERLFSAVPLLE